MGTVPPGDGLCWSLTFDWLIKLESGQILGPGGCGVSVSGCGDGQDGDGAVMLKG